MLLLIVSACGKVEASPSFPDRDTRRRQATGVREIASSSPDASFTAVDALDVDSRGFIYVPEMQHQRITVLDPGGKVVRAWGRRGRGPGEFRGVRSVQILPGDSVLAYDPSLGRISVFAPGSDEAAYTVSLGTRGAVPFDVRRTGYNAALLALYRPQFQFLPGADFSNRTDRVRLLALDGSRLYDLVEFPSKAFLVAQNSVMPHPFGNEGFARLDSRNRLFFVRSDSLGAARYQLDGRRDGGFAIAYRAPEITRRDHEEALAAIPAQVRARFTPALRDSLPERWPVVRDVLIDDRDRIWMLMGGSPRQGNEWAAFSTEGAYLGSMVVPAGSDARLIRWDRVYASRTDADDVPRVIVYQPLRPLR